MNFLFIFLYKQIYQDLNLPVNVVKSQNWI